MRVLFFGGGLGNQIFDYAFYLYVQEKCPNEKIWGLYNKHKLSEHYGLEIDKWFKVQLPRENIWASALTGVLFLLKKAFGFTKYLDLNQRIWENERAIVFNAFKYDKRYTPNTPNWLEWKIDEKRLSEQNKKVLQKIRCSNSWFIHVRRGDFLSEKYKKYYDGCCSLSYYKEAINEVLIKEKELTFFGFSDDIQWAKENLPNVNIHFIDWNQGENSPLDMFLMSNCKGAIIANSTFSYWGAYLGYKKTVYYPQKWININPPSIFPNEWIGI